MNRKKKSILSVICCMSLIFSLIAGISGVGEKGQDRARAKSRYAVSQEEINSFFGDSAILGHSVGLGLKYYFEKNGTGFLGNPTMLVWGCYSFLNDFENITQYMIHYGGKPMKARDAVKACGVKHVFINMGINDFNPSGDQILNHYKRYIHEIKTVNPDVDIFILASTPTRIAKGRLNNTETDKLNNNMKELAEQKKDLYYIDINTPLKDSSGALRAGYASDGFVHLTYDAYRVWTDVMVKSVRQMLRNQKKAKGLVKKAKEKLTWEGYNKAKEFVAGLDKSSVKHSLRDVLKEVKEKIREKEAQESESVSGSVAKIQQSCCEKKSAARATGMPGIVTSSAASAVPKQTGSPRPTTVPTASPQPTGVKTPLPTITPDPNELTEVEKERADIFISKQVENLAVSKDIEGKVILTWSSQYNAEDYYVLRSEDKKTGYKSIGTTRNLKYKDKTAEKRKTYYYKVQAHMTIRNKSFDGKPSKRKKVYVYPKKPLTVMCGECFMVGMQKFTSIFGSDKPFVAKIGLNTYTLLHNNYFSYNGQSVTGIERIAYYKPDRVYFLVGGNESAWTTTGWTMNNYTKVRELLRKINSHVQIILIKIAPCGVTSPENIPSVTQRATFNNAYKSFADRYNDVFFCPATDVLDDGTSHLSRSYDAGDGCHWNDSGSAAVANKIREWSKEVFHNW
ncbi:MAG: hypothetical protein IKQ97_10745 [Eubacterium sp.]|nr:hypothetical protein [Eubacterium sp.]